MIHFWWTDDWLAAVLEKNRIFSRVDASRFVVNGSNLWGIVRNFNTVFLSLFPPGLYMRFEMHEGCKTHWPCLFNWVSKLLWASEFFRICLQLRRRKGQQKRRKRKNAHGCSHLQGSSPWLSSVCTTGRRALHSSSTFAADLPAVEVMMFGMTGAGKSALGNLIAGQNIFDSGSLTPDRCRMMALGPIVIKRSWHSCEGGLLTNSLKTYRT